MKRPLYFLLLSLLFCMLLNSASAATYGTVNHDGVRFRRKAESTDVWAMLDTGWQVEILNTKRAKIEEGGKMEWVSGSFGSHVSYLYPMTILNGAGAQMEYTGITFAGKGQNLDTGMKVVHNAPNTTSVVSAKSISKDGGISTYRSSVVVNNKAKGAKSSVSCASLMLDDISRSDTIPAMDVRTQDADVGHEAKIGRISDEAVFYLMSRGISEEDARAMIVSGFADNVSKELPLEYAVEMNNLIRLEMKGTIG